MLCSRCGDEPCSGLMRNPLRLRACATPATDLTISPDFLGRRRAMSVLQEDVTDEEVRGGSH